MLCRFSESGELLWSVNHGTPSTDYGLSLTGVSDGGFAVSGCVTEDLYQGWVLRTDSLGSIESPLRVMPFQATLEIGRRPNMILLN